METDNSENLLSAIFVHARLVYLLLGFGFIATAAIIAGTGNENLDAVLGLCTWALGPYVLVGAYVYVRIKGKKGVIPSLILSGMLTLSGPVTMAHIAYISKGAQSGLGLFIFPFLQYIGVTIFIIIDVIALLIIRAVRGYW